MERTARAEGQQEETATLGGTRQMGPHGVWRASCLSPNSRGESLKVFPKYVPWLPRRSPPQICVWVPVSAWNAPRVPAPVRTGQVVWQ